MTPATTTLTSQEESEARPLDGAELEVPAHHVRRRFPWLGALFDNPWDTAGDPSGLDMFRLMAEWAQKRNMSFNATLRATPKPTEEDFAKTFPMHPVDWRTFGAKMEESEIRCVWVGHATCLVKFAGVTFLTDPVFSERCSPVQFMGPKRLVQPAFQIEDPEFSDLDFVVISHCHYDHLDYHSVKSLHRKFGSALAWYVPLKLKKWFTNLGIHNVTEMDWWSRITHKQITITFLPAQHWSNRSGILDWKRTLWGGWLVESNRTAQKVWFAGDTGYSPVFKEIGERVGPFDLSLIPIGAYDPRWFMKYQHINPEEAVKIHQDVQSKQSMAIHCCTFCLTFEDVDEPPARLKEEMKAQGLGEHEFLTVCHGELLHIKHQDLVTLPKRLPVETLL